MKKLFLPIVSSCLAVILLFGCKKSLTTNNYISRDTLSAYTFEGIGDITLSTDIQFVTRDLTIKYTDSAQQLVHLSFAGLPAGITIGNEFNSVGYPTFTTRLKLYDTALLQPAEVGDYPVTFNIRSSSGQLKSYPFTLHVLQPSDSCLTDYIKIYPTCDNGVSSWADTVTADGTIPNKIWFSNFNGEGLRVAGMVRNCQVSIPAQIVGGKLISGGGNATTDAHLLLNVKIGDSFYILKLN